MIKRSTSSFAAVVDGVPRVVPVGHLVEDGDPLLVGREHLFEPVETHLARREPAVEQATAAPGERRSISGVRPGRARGKASEGKGETGKEAEE
ncbi:hypothetical protein ACFYY8_33615 [Streptosporangium sp. NPDC001559]|uniref:hypothetical protein n=1 Tax=unclassified Streptosporangium TaxID=2632669 RepID=UPI003316B0D6